MGADMSEQRLSEAINGMFQAAKRRTCGYIRMSALRTAIFLITGKLDFCRVTRIYLNPLSLTFLLMMLAVNGTLAKQEENT